MDGAQWRLGGIGVADWTGVPMRAVLVNTEYGVMVGPDYPPQPPLPGVVATGQSVKSAFELPWNTTLPAGPQVISGRSWSGRSNIRKVDVSLDGGRTWQAARLREPNVEKAWVRWCYLYDGVVDHPVWVF